VIKPGFTISGEQDFGGAGGEVEDDEGEQASGARREGHC